MFWLEPGQRPLLCAIVLTTVMMALLVGRPHFTSATRPPRGIADPMLALDVARDVDEVDAILGDAPSPDREVMRLKEYLGFGLIASYVSFFVVLSARMRGFAGTPAAGRNTWIQRATWAATACAMAAAVCDLTKNFAILRLLDADLNHTTPAMIDRIRWPGLAEWALGSAAMGLLASVFLKSPRWPARIAGSVNAIAAALGCWGLFDNAWLVWTGPAIFAGLLLDAATLKFLTV